MKPSVPLSIATGLAVAIIAAATCSPDQKPEAGITVRDSSGIRIVENHISPESLPVYRELGAIELEVGVRDGPPEYTLTEVISVRTMDGGGLVVAESRTRELRIFDGAGRHVRTLGGIGEGPGEFSSLSTLSGLSGDTLWA